MSLLVRKERREGGAKSGVEREREEWKSKRKKTENEKE